jgi:molybdopterin molybdotransferase
MVEKRNPITVNEAIEHVMRFARTGEKINIPLHESYGHFLAEDLVADHHVPPFDRSPYDGFAVRSQDTEQADRNDPLLFEVIGEIGAGSVFEGQVGEQQAVRIMTGAQMPEGCDAVVMLEMADELTKNDKPFFYLKKVMKSGENISFTGEDTKKGEVLARKGTYINPGIVALLATFGYKEVPVRKKPKVGIIATGSELLDVDEPLEPGKIRNSNAYMVHSQVIRAGGEPVDLGQFNDDFETCYEQVKNALEQMDLVLTTGGVSVGDYDYLPDIYKKLEANVLFNKIRMRPGSVTTVAEKDGKLLFGLSGNPSACYVGFELYTRPVIREYVGSKAPFNQKVVATLGADFPKANPFDRFVRGHVSYENGKIIITPVGLDKSNVVSSLGEANGLILLPGGTRGYEKGMKVTAILLEDQEGQDIESFIHTEVSVEKGESK